MRLHTTIFFNILFCTMSTLFCDASPLQNRNKPGIIIILNGPSAAGKSTLQKEIQKTFEPLYLTVGIDGFFDAILPHDFPDGKSIVGNEFIRGVTVSQDVDGNNVIKLDIGPRGRMVITGMHQAFAAYAAAGNNLVIDYILYEADWLPELVTTLQNCKVYFVGITTPLAVIEQRERARGTSPAGHARSHYHTVHAHGTYDLEIDTSKIAAQDAAQIIKQFIQDNPEPTAFKKLQRTKP